MKEVPEEYMQYHSTYKVQAQMKLNNRLFRERAHGELSCKGKQEMLTRKTV